MQKFKVYHKKKKKKFGKSKEEEKYVVYCGIIGVSVLLGGLVWQSHTKNYGTSLWIEI